MAYFRYPRYVSVGEKRAKAEKKLKQLRKKNPQIRPVSVEGRTLARTWWGKSWNQNLERYADFANRIGRGRSYLRHKAVLDLQIEPGRVSALVAGSRAKPYEVNIDIAPLKPKSWQAIKSACSGEFDSLKDLLGGKFPKSLKDLFMARGSGLFPLPAEIQLSCSCPDWAVMCKHVAATLYGIGTRLDEDPSLFFTLRKVEMQDLVSETVRNVTDQLLEKARGGTENAIADTELGDMFGIELEEGFDLGSDLPAVAENAKAPGSNAIGSKAVKSKPASSRRTKTSKPEKAPKSGTTPSDKPVKNKKAAQAKALILDMIDRSPRGIDVPAIRNTTGLDTVKIRNTVYQAYSTGRIEKVGRGIYRGKMSRIDPAVQLQLVVDLVNESPAGIDTKAVSEGTGFPLSRVRYLINRAFAKRKIQRKARGIYAPVKRGRSEMERVLEAIRAATDGIGFALLRDESGVKEKRLRTIVAQLRYKGQIRSVRRGVYVADG